MPTPIKDIVARIDEIMERAYPDDGSAPLQPIIDLGNYLVDTWPAMRKKLLNGQSTQSEGK